MKKIVIVGGVAGGATAAARIRRLDDNAQIVIFERSGYISYANCGLPYYIGNVIKNKNNLTLQTPESFWNRFRIDVRVRHEVTAVNIENKTVTVRKLDTGEIFEESFDNLILSPGAKPTIPNIKGIDSDEIFTLRTVEDTLNIKNFINMKKPKSATIIGAGFIGVEMAENLTALGIQVTVVEYADHIIGTLDFDMSCFVKSEMSSHGICFILKASVREFEKKNDKIISYLSDDSSIESDIVIVAIGVTPDTVLAKSSGLELGIKDSIVVNSKMQTSVPYIYAVGDAVEVKNYISNNKALISLAGPANKQARIAADNICGVDSKFNGSQGSSVIKIFDMTVATTGMNETLIKLSDIEYEKIILSPASHATYYPGSKVMTIKLMYDKKTKKILGCQIIGYDGVDKRIDVIATAIRSGMRVFDLAELELSYSPPYSSAKDPVNMIGYIAENIEKQFVKQFYYEDLDKIKELSDAFLLDTRTVDEYNLGHISGFVNIPLDNLRENLYKISKNKTVYVICQSGLRSYIACRILSQNGYECYNFSGGYRLYSCIKEGIKQLTSSYSCGLNIKEEQ